MTYLFDNRSFEVFQVEGVEQRMEAVKSVIQPSFDYYGHYLADYLEDKLMLDEKPFVHIAKHLRRTVYPVESTWCAIGGDKRGYKKYPHFQIGINEDYVFYMLSYIDNIEHKQDIAKSFSTMTKDFESLSSDFVVIPDHTQLDYTYVQDLDFKLYFDRLMKVKKAEFMIGRIIKRTDLIDNESDMKEWLVTSTDALLPFQQDSMRFFENQ